MANLYQLINQQFGGSGWKSAYPIQQKIYEALGSPYGRYVGSSQQNNWLLSQQGNWGNAYSGTQQQVTPADPNNPTTPTPSSKTFESAFPWLDTWNAIRPAFEAEASMMVTPELQRGLNSATRDYMKTLAAQGGGRFGFGGVGDLQSQYQQQQKAAMEDWVASRQAGYKSLFYDPARDAWNQALELGKAPNAEDVNIPTYEKFMQDVGEKYVAPVANNTPLTSGFRPGSGYYGNYTMTPNTQTYAPNYAAAVNSMGGSNPATSSLYSAMSSYNRGYGGQLNTQPVRQGGFGTRMNTQPIGSSGAVTANPVGAVTANPAGAVTANPANVGYFIPSQYKTNF